MAVVTISRGTLSATQELTSFLAEDLHYRVIDREEVCEAAKPYGIDETGLGTVGIVDQHPPSFWHRFTDKRRQYLVCFKAALLDCALEGRLVYIGHLAHLLLQDYPRVLRVRLAAPNKYRVQRLRDERGISEAEAEAIISEIDDRRLRWSQFLYDVDWRDPTHYDLVINPEKVAPRTAATLVVECAQSTEFRPTAEDLARLRDLRLRTVVQAAILRSPRTRGVPVDVSASAGSGDVLVRGEVPKTGHAIWEQDVRSVVADVEGVRSVSVQSSTTPISE